MPDIALALTSSTGFAPTWGAVSFDHAAMVAAGRSRADGYDLYVWHTSYGVLPTKARGGMNTATATVDFIAVTTAVDSGYRIGFGNLGQQTDRIVGGVYTYAGSMTTATVPAVALPAPAHALTRTKRISRGEFAYPESVALRRRDWHENEEHFYRAEWRDITPDDWYEIRAWVAAHAGGAAGSVVSWANSRTLRPLPGSFSASQHAGRFTASLELAELVA